MNSTYESIDRNIKEEALHALLEMFGESDIILTTEGFPEDPDDFLAVLFLGVMGNIKQIFVEGSGVESHRAKITGFVVKTIEHLLTIKPNLFKDLSDVIVSSGGTTEIKPVSQFSTSIHEKKNELRFPLENTPQKERFKHLIYSPGLKETDILRYELIIDKQLQRIKEQIDEKGEASIVVAGSLATVYQFIDAYPKEAQKLKIFFMGDVKYNNEGKIIGFNEETSVNVKLSSQKAQKTFEFIENHRCPLTVINKHTNNNAKTGISAKKTWENIGLPGKMRVIYQYGIKNLWEGKVNDTENFPQLTPEWFCNMFHISGEKKAKLQDKLKATRGNTKKINILGYIDFSKIEPSLYDPITALIAMADKTNTYIGIKKQHIETSGGHSISVIGKNIETGDIEDKELLQEIIGQILNMLQTEFEAHIKLSRIKYTSYDGDVKIIPGDRHKAGDIVFSTDGDPYTIQDGQTVRANI